MWLREVLLLLLLSCGALRHAEARSLRSGYHGVSIGEASSSTGFEFDLSNLRLKAQASASSSSASNSKAASKGFFQFANASVGGLEVACINCDTGLFVRWVRQRQGFKEAACKEEADADAVGGGSKHPNAPGYNKWANKKAAAVLLEKVDKNSPACDDFSGFNASDVQVSAIRDWDLDGLRPRLQMLWAERRLVIGYGSNPLRQSMDFGDILMNLARNAPMVTPKECEKGMVPHCGAVLSGLRKTATTDDLEKALETSFGAAFMNEHRLQKHWNATEQRRHIQAILVALKGKYSFYYQKCLAHEKDTATCNKQAASTMLGQIACQPQDDELQDDCVYAELRLCRDCEKTSSFFEYSRFHGPLALFDTMQSRMSVMGQCEEFSRAGHALLAFLGYEVRYILDFTDHVWVEVRIPSGTSNGTWVHADPSEGVLDNPLMYEQGWGKQLSMIFAFTPSSVEHVTATYTKNYAATVVRRGLPDFRLTAVLEQVNHRLQYELPINNWGYTVQQQSSKERTLREVALWSHFEAR